MAARPADGGRISLSPRAMRIAGWLAAIVLIGLVALVVRVLGGNADGTSVLPSPSPSQAGPAPIAFGTALDPVTSQVPDASRTDRFVAGDTFAYSVPAAAGRPEVVHVAVERTAGGPTEIVQSTAEGRQVLPADRLAVAFTVPADVLLAAFGPGTYVMRIHGDPAGDPIAEGTFELLETTPASSG
jgi:hypothetical protein